MPTTDREYLEKVGTKIKARRKKLNMSQADLAYKIGMDVPNLSVIENGKSNPQILTLLRIASALEMQLNQLLPKLDAPSTFLETPGEYTPRKLH
jgi:transcriptional regulator with XRE-family HTH domain